MYLRDKGKGHENRKCMKMVQGRAVCFGGGGGVAAAAATGVVVIVVVGRGGVAVFVSNSSKS